MRHWRATAASTTGAACASAANSRDEKGFFARMSETITIVPRPVSTKKPISSASPVWM
ncbi:MAG: hypothetical protein V9G18_11865 [Albidovulum sp.]